MARLLLVLLLAFVATTTAIINCCAYAQSCRTACVQMGCDIMYCCGNGCTIGSQYFRPCDCICGGCPNMVLAKYGLLGKALGDTVFINDSNFTILH